MIAVVCLPLAAACAWVSYLALGRRMLADARWRHHIRQGIRQWRTEPLYAAKRDADDMMTWTLILLGAWCGLLLFGYVVIAAAIEAIVRAMS